VSSPARVADGHHRATSSLQALMDIAQPALTAINEAAR